MPVMIVIDAVQGVLSRGQYAFLCQSYFRVRLKYSFHLVLQDVMSQLLRRHTGLYFLVPLVTFPNIVPNIPCLYHVHGQTREAATKRHGENIFCAYELSGKSTSVQRPYFFPKWAYCYYRAMQIRQIKKVFSKSQLMIKYHFSYN